MLNRIVVCVLIVGTMASCNMQKKEAAWTRQVDSLRSELALHTSAMQTLDEVGILIDSIDVSRDLLRTGIVEGLPHDSFTARLGEINAYVKASRMKIEDLEQAVKKNNSSNSSLKTVIAKLKADLKQKGEEITLLTAAVERYRIENDSLTGSLTMQSAELNDKREEITIQSSVKSYLYRMVRNSCLNVIKHQKVIREHEAHESAFGEPVYEGATQGVMASELERKISSALKELPEQCRLVFQLSRFEELKYAEIADQLNISVKTVENHMGKALRIMREQLKDYLPLFLIFMNVWTM